MGAKRRKHGAPQLSDYLLTEVIRNFWNLFNRVRISTSAINHSLMTTKILGNYLLLCFPFPPTFYILFFQKASLLSHWFQDGKTWLFI